MKHQCISMLKKKQSNSPVWNDLLQVKDAYVHGRKMIVGNGNKTNLWKDTWCTELPLVAKFADLFNICNEQKCSVAQLAHSGSRLTFRHWLGENLQNHLRELCDILTFFALNEEDDYPKWCWEKSGIFMVKSAYEHLCCNETGASYKIFGKQKFL